MKAILEFNLNDFDDQQAHERCIKATDLALVIWEFLNQKKGFEYEAEYFETDNDPYELIEKIYKKFYELLHERGINIYNLV